jgi:hypothetical protein
VRSAYPRALASAFHRFADLLVLYPTTGTRQVNGPDVFGLEPMVKGEPIEVNSYLAVLRGDARFVWGESRGAMERAGWGGRVSGDAAGGVGNGAVGIV